MIPLVGTWRTYYQFWKTSLADFIASMIAFWVSLFVSTEIGIASAVGFNIVYVLLRQVFIRFKSIGSDSESELASYLDAARGMPARIPSDTRVFRFNESVFFPNALRNKTKILDDIQTYHAAEYGRTHGEEADRMWSVEGEKRIKRLRKQARTDGEALPPITVVVLDFTKVNFCDVSAVTALKNFFMELKKYAGEQVEVRFVAMSDMTRHRFERAGWKFLERGAPAEPFSTTAIRAFNSIAEAVMAPRLSVSDDLVEVKVKGDEDEGATITHREKQ